MTKSSNGPEKAAARTGPAKKRSEKRTQACPEKPATIVEQRRALACSLRAELDPLGSMTVDQVWLLFAVEFHGQDAKRRAAEHEIAEAFRGGLALGQTSRGTREGSTGGKKSKSTERTHKKLAYMTWRSQIEQSLSAPKAAAILMKLFPYEPITLAAWVREFKKNGAPEA